MQTKWFRKVHEVIEGQDVEGYVAMYANQYKAQSVCTSVKTTFMDQSYCIEVWVHLDASAHVIVVYPYTNTDEEDTAGETE